MYTIMYLSTLSIIISVRESGEIVSKDNLLL